MTIETKFSLGDKVYKIHNERIIKGIIFNIKIEVKYIKNKKKIF